MTSFVRWVTFNLVGAVGMVVQLAALALFNRLLHGSYLIASAAALEITLLHNFLWHTQCTWRDRRDGFSLRRQLARFHLSNGLLSLAGNMALMRLLVHAAHLPVLIANVIAVLCCSGANFWFSHHWTFSAPRHRLGRDSALYSRGHSLSASCTSTRRSFDVLGGACTAAECPFLLPAADDVSTREHAASGRDTCGPKLRHRELRLSRCRFLRHGCEHSEVRTVPAAACGAGISFQIRTGVVRRALRE